MNHLKLTALSGFVLLSSVLQSCSDAVGSYRNDKISAGKRADFHALNDQVFKDLKANNPKHLENMMSAEMIENSYTKRQVELIGNRLDSGYAQLDEFYIVNRAEGRDSIQTATYKINYLAATREMYIGFFIPKTAKDKWLITIVYCKYDYGWKINALDLAPYMKNGKDAPQLYNMAKEKYKKKFLIDAVNTMELAWNCARPSTMWQYPKEHDMNTFYKQVLDEANAQFKFPIVMKQVKTQPRIFRIFNQEDNGGTYPKIYYLSRINIKDTVALKDENENIKRAIGTVLPGIDQDKKYVFYAVFNEMPTGKKTVDYFEMTQHLKR